ncbi:hypothetical protein OF829_04520 [Sphingomonas sp. LB-2]|uniref:hypothetical protein n=1 Tax=Sphingomonas caeni TaxID=2984949 RepID=UPI00223217B2|nr:hypothetical protein [Sphingomonas caeni]MCW3846491.1 hypothetical protein [Sphingomonas caeni]
MTDDPTLAQSALRALVPAFYKSADALHPAAIDDVGPLQALLDILAHQGEIVEADIARLYDDWFIETCSDWAIPYIGALVRARALPSATPDGQRRYIANTIAYRRRKGTVAVIEQLARDVTGWPALANESFRGLALTQAMLHVRPGRHGTADVRNSTRASAAGTPFDAFSHTLDVRRPGKRGARWSIPTIALFLWRQQAALLEAIEAVPDPVAPWLFHADPELRARPWFNWARTDSDVDQRAHEYDLPVPLRRRPLVDELAARRRASAAAQTPPSNYFPDDDPAFRIEVQDVVGGAWRTIKPEAVRVVHLGGAPASIAQPDKAIPVREGGVAPFTDAEILVDPALGRVAIPLGVATPVALRTNHLQGYGAEIGAGPFDRNRELAALIGAVGAGSPVTWQASVMKGRADIPADNLFGTLNAAVSAWNALPAGPRNGLILIEDSARHDLGAGVTATLKPGTGLTIAAGRWPADLAQPLPKRFGHFQASACRPHLTGNIRVKGNGPSQFGMSGIFQTGKCWIQPGLLEGFTARHCTFDLGQPLVADLNTQLVITLDHCLCGPLSLDPLLPDLRLSNSIVHAPLGGAAIIARGAKLTIESCSVFGTTGPVRELWASNTLFNGIVTTSRTQYGCTRFCYVPDGSRTPRRHRCQSKLAVDAGAPAARVKPHIVSLDRASPWYGQLHPLAHPALRKGGDDGGEIGAFRTPSSALLEANVDATLDEYLRLGMAAGILIAT